MKKNILKFTVIFTFLTALVLSCGKSSGTGGSLEEILGTIIDSDKPENSTGVEGTIALAFSTLESATALTLADDTITLESGIKVSEARVNIAAIKLKAKKEFSEDEKTQRKEARVERKKQRKELRSKNKELFKKRKDLRKKRKERNKRGNVTDAEKEAHLKSRKEFESKKAEVELKRAEFEAKYEKEHDSNIRWNGPYEYNLITKAISPALEEVKVPDGDYKRIEFLVKPNRKVKSEDKLLNKSLYIKGESNGVAFEVSFQIRHNFRLSGASAFDVNAEKTNKLNIAFSLEKWLAGVDFSAATVEDGIALVDRRNNTEIFKIIRKNIKSSTKFGKDKDGDGKLETAEVSGSGEENITALEEEAEEAEADEAEEEKALEE